MKEDIEFNYIFGNMLLSDDKWLDLIIVFKSFHGFCVLSKFHIFKVTKLSNFKVTEVQKRISVKPTSFFRSKNMTSGAKNKHPMV